MSGPTFAPVEIRRPSDPEVAVLLRFLARLGQAELAAGNAVPLVERDLGLIAKRNGVEGVTAYVLPTVLFIELDNGQQHTVDLAPGPYRIGTLRFDQVEEVLTIARKARTGELAPEEGLRRIEAVWRMRHRYGNGGFVAGYLLTTIGLAMLLRPTIQGLATVAGLALVSALLLLAARKRPAWMAILPVFSAFALSALVALGYQYGLRSTALNLLIPPLIIFLPGMALTISVIELAYGNVVSGSTRLVAGFAQLILLAFGIVGGFKAFGTGLPVTAYPEAARLPQWLPWLGLPIFGWGLHMYQSSKLRSLGWMGLTLLVAYVAQYLVGRFFPWGSTAFFGALCMTVGALVIEFRFKGPPAIVTFLPAFWLLAPGSFGLLSVTSITTEAAATAHDILTLLFTLVGIAMGCLIGAFLYSLLLHPKRITWWNIQEP